VLVIDEMNRGDLSFIFGEAYHLLEYRDFPVTLAKSQQEIALPHNLLIIGTMNSVSVTTPIDPALHRRFMTIPFVPNASPIEGLLRRWLCRKNPQLVWIADVVDRANDLIGDSQRMIGPGYFMLDELTPTLCRAIWDHSVIPYITQVVPSSQISRFQFTTLEKDVVREHEDLARISGHNTRSSRLNGNGFAKSR
jgi:hypothetical protein